MIAFPSMAAHMAAGSGMKVPNDPDRFDPKEYPHFALYCKVQLGVPVPYPSAARDNAQLIADLTEGEVKTLTYSALVARGLAVGYK